jgi:hypothetical protein
MVISKINITSNLIVFQGIMFEHSILSFILNSISVLPLRLILLKFNPK